MKVKYAICAAISTPALLFSSCGNGSLKDVTKPYLGEYDCKSALLGDVDFLDEFSYIKLELKQEGTFSLYYATKEGKKGEETGQYVYDEENETLTFSHAGLGEVKRKFPLKEGSLSIVLPLGAKTLTMQFSRK